VLNFNLVSETQPKMNIRTYLFVLKSSFERISRKKRKFRNSFRDFFHILTLLVSSVLANTHIKLWAGRNTHERFLDQTSQERRFNNLTVFERRPALDTF